MKAAPSHSALVAAACKWLKVRHRCEVILPEFHTFATEHEKPDVIAWNVTVRDGARSILVECKTSRADFLADRKKPVRTSPELGMGQCRWFFTPSGLLDPRELPAGWGLAEWDGGPTTRVRHRQPPSAFTSYARHHEISLLVQEIRRSDNPHATPGGKTMLSKWGPKRFRGEEPSPPKVVPCRGRPHCPGCDFCVGPVEDPETWRQGEPLAKLARALGPG